MRRLVAVVALLVLVATACKIETNFAATINADGSGTVTVELGFDDEAQELLLQGEDPFDGQDLTDLPGAETREETRGDMNFYIVTAPVDDVAEIEQALLGDSNSLLESFEITITDTLVSVNGTASAEDAFGEDLEGFDPGLIEESLSASVRLTMPGKILSSNADSQDGNTLTWQVPLFGGNLNIQAESDPTQEPSGDGGFPVALIAVLVIVALGAAAWFFMNRRKTAAPEAPEADAAPEAPEEIPPPPPPAE